MSAAAASSARPVRVRFRSRSPHEHVLEGRHLARQPLQLGSEVRVLVLQAVFGVPVLLLLLWGGRLLLLWVLLVMVVGVVVVVLLLLLLVVLHGQARLCSAVGDGRGAGVRRPVVVGARRGGGVADAGVALVRGAHGVLGGLVVGVMWLRLDAMQRQERLRGVLVAEVALVAQLVRQRRAGLTDGRAARQLDVAGRVVHVRRRRVRRRRRGRAGGQVEGVLAVVEVAR